MRASIAGESSACDFSFSRNRVTASSSGPRAVTTSGDRPRDSELNARSTAASSSALQSRSSRTASTSSRIASKPLPSAHSMLTGGHRRDRSRHRNDLRLLGHGPQVDGVRQQSFGSPVRNERVLDALRSNCENSVAAVVPDQGRPTHRKVSSSTTSSETTERPCRNSASSCSTPTERFIATKSTRPMGRDVCRATCTRTSASSIGVTGWVRMTGCLSRRKTLSPCAAKRWPNA